MSNNLSVVLVAIGGYGGSYVESLLDGDVPGVSLGGAVDPFPQGCTRLGDLKARDVPVFDNTDDCFTTLRPDLTVISSPIQMHCRHTCAALENGSHVLCEKPLAATVQEGLEMIAARDRAGKQVAIGYQWSFSPQIQRLKADILSGRFGAPVSMKTLVLWPRNHAYYGRNSWAGALRDEHGDWVLDSPIGNATAHYLHNMLFLLGDSMHTSAVPATLVGELYRANEITNYDTGAVRVKTDEGYEILYLSTHASRQNYGPAGEYRFENAVITQTMQDGITATLPDGSTVVYGQPEADTTTKLASMCSSLAAGTTVACPIEAALSHTICLNGLQESAEVAPFPIELVGTAPHGESTQTYAEGVGDWLRKCNEQNALPSEVGAPWATPGQTVDLRGYTRFPSTE